MILHGKTTKGDKNSIILICVRDKQELEELIANNKSTNDDGKDDLVSNKNTNVKSEDTNDDENCTKLLPSNATNELNDSNIQQPECHKACESDDVKMDNPIRADNESSKENFKSGSDKLDVIPTTNENTESNMWDDYDCYKISQEDFFPSKIMDLDTQKLVITRFLNFYVGGKIPKGLRATDVIFAVISIIPLTGATEEFIWHEIEYRDDGSLFFLTPEEKLNIEFKAIVTKAKQNCTYDINSSKINTSSSITRKQSENERTNNTDSTTSHNETTPSKSVEENHDVDSSIETNTTSSNEKDILSSYITDLIADMSIKWRGLKSNREPSQQCFKQYGPAENSAFISSCNKLLLAWEESEESRIMLKYFFGIIALTLMRGIVKGKKNIFNTFINEKFQKNFLFTDSKINYSRPHESCVEKCCRELRLNERHHKVMFAKMLFNSIRIDYMQRINLMSPYYGFYNIFRMCVIDHIAYYDMGIINLLKTIYSCVGPGMEFSIILNDLKSEETDHSMEQIKNFILKYMRKTNCCTYHWARYFDSKQFEYLSCSKSYATAVVLAVFVEKMTRRADVWRSGWVRAQHDDLDRYKELAQRMYEEFEHLQSKKNVLCQQFFRVV